MCPFSILAFLQPTTVDKEPKTHSIKDSTPDTMRFLILKTFA